MKVTGLKGRVEAVQVEAASLGSGIGDNSAAIDFQRRSETVVMESAAAIVSDICAKRTIGDRQRAEIVNAAALAFAADGGIGEKGASIHDCRAKHVYLQAAAAIMHGVIEKRAVQDCGVTKNVKA